MASLSQKDKHVAKTLLIEAVVAIVKRWWHSKGKAVLVYGVLLASPVWAQPTLTVEEHLRLEVLQLKQQLKDQRQEYVTLLAQFSACVSTSFSSASGPFDDQIRKAYQAWLKDIETQHPGMTWNGQKLVKKEPQ